ncbi:MAG: hypothetical protein DCF25_17400 [Leptolyngbya foveolarum]|uniref:Uncharacterized protein n=1 Tax=Leptolyngbya foveolarum TaxID=47253 RepID=A0A2W4TU51_9CYAN|nr:MAG: hypothetical protein DCF25_17400 [Leptolyngbya foveolarum]
MVSQSAPSTRRTAKAHSQPTLWSVATVFFALGAAVSTLAIWQLHKLYMVTVAPVITVEGTVQAKYSFKTENELSPDPSGYYINSPGVGRVYLTGKALDSYVGKPVAALGSVSGVCGPKSVPCYPIVAVREITISAAE